MPGTTPRTVSALDTTRQPASSLSKVTSAETSRRSGGVPARPRAPDSAIEKQAAWAAATSSSGLVLPSGRLGPGGPRHGQGRERSRTRRPRRSRSPWSRAPDQVASARRMAAIDFSFVWCGRVLDASSHSASGGRPVRSVRTGSGAVGSGARPEPVPTRRVHRDGQPIPTGRCVRRRSSPCSPPTRRLVPLLLAGLLARAAGRTGRRRRATNPVTTDAMLLTRPATTWSR